MTLHGEVEPTQAVTRQAVSAALQDNGARLIPIHDPLDDKLVCVGKCLVADTIMQRHVDTVAATLALAGVSNSAGSREEWLVVAILKESSCQQVKLKNSRFKRRTLWREKVNTLSVPRKASSTPSPWCTSMSM